MTGLTRQQVRWQAPRFSFTNRVSQMHLPDVQATEGLWARIFLLVAYSHELGYFLVAGYLNLEKDLERGYEGETVPRGSGLHKGSYHKGTEPMRRREEQQEESHGYPYRGSTRKTRRAPPGKRDKTPAHRSGGHLRGLLAEAGSG